MKKYLRFYAVDWYEDNSIDALVPEMWVQEALRQFRLRTVVLPFMNRDYADEFAQPGDVINLNKTGPLTTKRKFKGQEVETEAVTATDDWVRLNQHLYSSFYLDDHDLEQAFGDLVSKYLVESMVSMTHQMDLIGLGEGYHFYPYTGGSFGTDADDAAVLALRESQNRLNLPPNPRTLMVGSATETMLLNDERFVEARMIGDGKAIRTGELGMIRGFDVFSGSQVPEVTGTFDATTAEINLGAGYAAGTTTIVVNGITGSTLNGTWFTVEGDMTPQRVVSTTETAGDTTGITFEPGLAHAVVDDADIVLYDPGAVNQAASPTGYAFQYGDVIVYDTFTNNPVVGQGVTFAADGDPYMIVGVDTSGKTIQLNRPLDVAIANDALICLMPPGNYNPTWNHSAVTFINRPLRPVKTGAGVRSAYAAYGGVAFRVNIGYDQGYMGYRITVDTLCAVRTLNQAAGGLLLS